MSRNNPLFSSCSLKCKIIFFLPGKLRYKKINRETCFQCTARSVQRILKIFLKNPGQRNSWNFFFILHLAIAVGENILISNWNLFSGWRRCPGSQLLLKVVHLRHHVRRHRSDSRRPHLRSRGIGLQRRADRPRGHRQIAETIFQIRISDRGNDQTGDGSKNSETQFVSRKFEWQRTPVSSRFCPGMRIPWKLICVFAIPNKKWID